MFLLIFEEVKEHHDLRRVLTVNLLSPLSMGENSNRGKYILTTTAPGV